MFKKNLSRLFKPLFYLQSQEKQELVDSLNIKTDVIKQQQQEIDKLYSIIQHYQQLLTDANSVNQTMIRILKNAMPHSFDDNNTEENV